MSYTLAEMKQDVYRNIINLLTLKKAMADLGDEDDILTASRVMQRVMDIKRSLLDVNYMAAIEYPFATDHFMQTRYSDGTFGIWYGSVDVTTTIYETAFHLFRRESMVQHPQGIQITVERMVYRVYCNSVLVDLTQSGDISSLIQEDDVHTQKIGKTLYEQGLTGLLSPSACYKNGININIFKSLVLQRPVIDQLLTYQLYITDRIVHVYAGSKLTCKIHV